MTVFADTFYWIALLNRRDEYHERVRLHVETFRGMIVTTQWVLAEVADAMSSSSARPSIAPFFGELETSGSVTMVKATDTLFTRGMALYRDRPDKQWTLTDCTSFVVMTDCGLTDALTGDHHFRQAGFHSVFE